MRKNNVLNNGIPISVSLNPALESENFQKKSRFNQRRLLTISALSFIIAVCVSFIAKLLVYLIDLFTNISFYGRFSFHSSGPADNDLGVFVIVVPVIGGLIVGLMAYYGSKAIRGHGIPEAMEQILTNQSRIKPAITYLKPLSAAISIGTGGPFGAEGPIIATGGALGSTIGQLLKISHNERKILLAAGATAGMSAIFGSPIAAIFLAIELLLFEFSPRSFIPVALACITGAAGHDLLFEGLVFPMSAIDPPSNTALFVCSIIGIVIGLTSVVITKGVYLIEDLFEKLPMHWAWWPALGGLAVGIVGYFNPRTLGVGYNNITEVLSGSLPLNFVISLGLLKLLSWAISLGSGTSGGTLAPLLTIGGAFGAVLGMLVQQWYPAGELTIPLAALIGMSAMFAGASRAFLTSIVFALETTGQFNALLPLLAACTASYFVSYFIMENTIMTEKIARRGVKTPHSYEPDILDKITVGQSLKDDGIIIGEENTIGEVRDWLDKESDYRSNYFIISSQSGEYKGLLSSSNLYSHHHQENKKVISLVKRHDIFISHDQSLRQAVDKMAKENVDVLPVISGENKNIIGVLSYRDILGSYKHGVDEHERKEPELSMKQLRVLVHGQKLRKIISKS